MDQLGVNRLSLRQGTMETLPQAGLSLLLLQERVSFQERRMPEQMEIRITLTRQIQLSAADPLKISGPERQARLRSLLFSV